MPFYRCPAKRLQQFCRFNWIWTICMSQFVHWKALYVQGTVADEQRLPSQLTFARLALLLVAAIARSQEMLWHLSCPIVGCNTECRTNTERYRTIKNTGKYKQFFSIIGKMILNFQDDWRVHRVTATEISTAGATKLPHLKVHQKVDTACVCFKSVGASEPLPCYNWWRKRKGHIDRRETIY